MLYGGAQPKGNQTMVHAPYPLARPRRLRRTAWSRRLVREHTLQPSDLIWPIFVIEGQNRREPIPSMPGVERLSIDLATEAVAEAARWGIPVVALFPNIARDLRTPDGAYALRPDTLICRAVRAIKAQVPEVGLLCDVALDPYTSHGHDGLLEDGEILNDPTVEALVTQALVQAEAGCDILAPSDMMDGRV
ncbi:MAG TPA: porphobilinogen synthase, partial [Alphaproteobacteria bacterium]|nr:porphobilinogen synthase [Alphaproteobacteria bacterium]